MKNLKIRTKLISLVVFLVVCLVSIGVLSMVSLNQVNQASTIIASNWMPSVIVAQNLNTLTSDFRIQEYTHILATSNSDMKAAETQMDTLSAQINENLDKYTTIITNDTDKALIEEVRTNWSAYLQIHEKMIALSRQNKTADAQALMGGEAKALFDTASASCLKIVEFNQTGGENASEEGDELYSSISTIVITGILVVILLSVIIAMYIIRTITVPVKEIDQVARKIADGNLDESITYSSKDELGVLAVNFNKTVTRLRDYVNYINEISQILDQISNGDLDFQVKYDYAGEFAKVKTAKIGRAHV